MADLTALANHLNPKKRTCRAIIETPRGFRNKFDYDPESNLFKLGGLLPEGMMFPFDFGFVPQTLGHYVENTGDTDLVFLEMFKAPRFQDISLNDWLTHIPPELVVEHLGISRQTLSAIQRANYAVLPA